MACDPTALSADACTNGFIQIAQNEQLYRGVRLQLLYGLSGSSSTAAEIKASACSNGLAQVAQVEWLYRAVKMQLLCQASGG